MWCAFWNRELRTVGIDIDDHAAQCDVKSSARCAIDNGLKHIYRDRYITQPNDDKLYSPSGTIPTLTSC
jgi:hypothetical protein